MWDAFHLALEVPEERREALLLELLGDEPEQLQEVRALLAAHEEGEPNELDVADVIDSLDKLDPSNLIGTSIDGYRIQELVGEGGMGLVYAAEQLEPIRRKVALKIIKLGMDTRDVIARFDSERQALALMDHPNIARILDAGSTDTGRPYFVMDYVPGVEITAYADQAKLGIDQRLRMFLSACEAVHHAHQKGVIHRDIKPSNILVSEVNGEPTVKIIDFGVAKTLTHKLTDEPAYTMLGHFIGTPTYISPEQAEMGALGVDIRSDIYSLGAVLCKLLTGQNPIPADAFAGIGPAQLPEVIRNTEILRPSTVYATTDDQSSTAAGDRASDTATLARQLSGDIDSIVLKALAKDRNDRYASVAEFAADIERYFNDEPVAAKPPARLYRAQKFVKRHSAAVSITAVLIVALLASLIGLSWSAVRTNNALETARLEQYRARASFDFLSSLLTRVAPDTTRGENAAMLESILLEASTTLDNSPPNDERVVADLSQTLAESYRVLGKFVAARKYAEQSLRIWRSELGADSPPALRAENLLALITWSEGNPVVARAALESTRARQIETLGEEHPEITATENNLALVMSSLGDSAAAMSLYETILDRQSKLNSENSNGAMRTRYNIAALKAEVGEFDVAEEELRRLSQRYADTQRSEDPMNIAVQSLLAHVLVKQQRSAEAAVVLEAASRAAEQSLNPNHPTALGLQIVKAELLEANQSLDEAVTVYDDTARAAEIALGEGHNIILTAMIGKGNIRRDQGMFEEAEQAFRKAARLAAASLPPQHPLRAIVTAQHGSALLNLDQPAEAVVLLTQSYQSLDELLGADNQNTRSALRDIVRCYEVLDQQELADEYRRKIFVVR